MWPVLVANVFASFLVLALGGGVLAAVHHRLGGDGDTDDLRNLPPEAEDLLALAA